MQISSRVAESRGFTLIELLVVVAIIGLLAAVVLASVGSARQKGVDAAVKSQLDSARTQTELYASGTNSYTGVCSAAASSNGLGGTSGPGILINAYNETAKSGGGVNVTASTAGSWNTVTCHENGAQWAIEAPLSASASGAPVMWCVDSNGSSRQESTNLAASGSTQYACP